jgi:hypothetical protein
MKISTRSSGAIKKYYQLRQLSGQPNQAGIKEFKKKVEKTQNAISRITNPNNFFPLLMNPTFFESFVKDIGKLFLQTNFFSPKKEAETLASVDREKRVLVRQTSLYQILKKQVESSQNQQPLRLIITDLDNTLHDSTRINELGLTVNHTGINSSLKEVSVEKLKKLSNNLEYLAIFQRHCHEHNIPIIPVSGVTETELEERINGGLYSVMGMSNIYDGTATRKLIKTGEDKWVSDPNYGQYFNFKKDEARWIINLLVANEEQQGLTVNFQPNIDQYPMLALHCHKYTEEQAKILTKNIEDKMKEEGLSVCVTHGIDAAGDNSVGKGQTLRYVNILPAKDQDQKLIPIDGKVMAFEDTIKQIRKQYKTQTIVVITAGDSANDKPLTYHIPTDKNITKVSVIVGNAGESLKNLPEICTPVDNIKGLYKQQDENNNTSYIYLAQKSLVEAIQEAGEIVDSMFFNN